MTASDIWQRFRRALRPDSPTFVSYSDGTNNRVGTYMVSDKEAALRGGHPKRKSNTKR